MARLSWGFGFRVDVDQDKDARYTEVLSAQRIPEICENDVVTAHDTVWSAFSGGEPTKPYAVFLSGWRDNVDDTFDIQTSYGTD